MPQSTAPLPSLYESSLHARAIIAAASEAHGTRAMAERGRFAVACTGRIAVDGHFTKPWETHEYRVEALYAFEPQTDTVALVKRARYNSEDKLVRTIITPTQLYRMQNNKVDLGPFTRNDFAKARFEIADILPVVLLRAAIDATLSLHWRGKEIDRGDAVDLVMFTGADGISREIAIDQQTHLVRRLTRLETDPMRGDEIVEITYAYKQVKGGERFLSHVRRTRSGRVEVEFDCVPVDDPSTIAMSLPADHQTTFLPEPFDPPPSVSVEKIGDGLYALEFGHLNSRALFLELPEYVIVFEAPYGSDAGELILKTIQQQTHGKPVRYLFLTHHHPDHSGGFRPFVAAGARIVTTRSNAQYLTEIANAPRALKPDALSLHPQTPTFDIVTDHRSFGAEPYLVEAFEVGSKTHHTEENIIYYLPHERLVFEGDFVHVPKNGPLEPASIRSAGLYDAIASLGLDVERVVQSWPVRNEPKVIAISTLKEMVRLRAESEMRP